MGDNPYDPPLSNLNAETLQFHVSKVAFRITILAMLGFMIAWFWIGQYFAVRSYARKGLPVEQLQSCKPAMTNFMTYGVIAGMLAIAIPRWRFFLIFLLTFVIHLLPYLIAIW